LFKLAGRRVIAKTVLSIRVNEHHMTANLGHRISVRSTRVMRARPLKLLSTRQNLAAVEESHDDRLAPYSELEELCQSHFQSWETT
jgi:hypothetical protein